MDLDLPGGPAGNPPIKKKRRSSILKMPTQIPLNGGAGSERGALQDLNLNSPQRIPPHAHTPTFNRRQSSKRVSFSSCKMVKEFETGSQTLTVWNNTYEEDHSHATSSSSHGTDSSSYSQDQSEIGILPPKKARHGEESPLNLDQSLFPSPPTRHAQFDRTVNATSAMELTRAMTPSPRGADLSVGSQVMEMTLAPGDDSGLSTLATSHYTNGFLQGLDTTTGEPEMEDVTQGMEMTKSVSRAYLLKMEERPSIVPPARTDVSSALHYLQGLDATSNSRSRRELHARECSGNFDQTTRSGTEELETSIGDVSTKKKAFDPYLSMELTNKVPVAQLAHGEESQKETTRSVSAHIPLPAYTKESLSSSVPIQQSHAEDPDESMEMTRAAGACIQSTIDVEQHVGNKGYRSGLPDKEERPEVDDESMELTKAIVADPKNTTNQDNNMEFTQSVNPSIMSGQKNSVVLDDSMDLTRAIKDSCPPNNKSQSQDDSMELTRAIKASIPTETKSQDDSMELTKAIKASIPTETKSQDESMELTKAIKASIPAETKSQDDNLEFTRAVQGSYSAETKSKDISFEFTRVSKACYAMKDQVDSMELTKSVSNHSQSKLINYENRSREQTHTPRTEISISSAIHMSSMEIAKAIHADIPSNEYSQLSVNLESPPSKMSTKEGRYDNDREIKLKNSGSECNQGHINNNGTESSSDKFDASNEIKEIPMSPTSETIYTDQAKDIAITMEITESVRHCTSNTFDEENHTQRLSMGVTTSKLTEQMQPIDTKPHEVSNKRSIAETFQVSPEKIHQEEISNPNNIQQAPEDVGTALEKTLEQESRGGLSQEDAMERAISSTASFHPNKSTNQESGPTEEQSSKLPEDLVSNEDSSTIIQSPSPCESNLVQDERVLPQAAPINVPEPRVKKTSPPVKPKRQKISIFAWLARLQSQTLIADTPFDHGRWELNNMTDWRATLSFLHNTLVLNISLGYSLPLDESWDNSLSIKHWTISSIEFQNPTLTQMCSNGDPAIKLIHRLILRQLSPSKLLKMCPSTLHLNEALASIGDIIRHGARFVLTLEDLASSHFYFAIHGLKITLGFLRKNLSFMVSVNFSHLENLGQSVEISNAKGPVDQMTLKYLAVSVFKRENIDEWKFLAEFVSEVEQYLGVDSEI